MGQLVGKAMYEGTVVGLPLSRRVFVSCYYCCLCAGILVDLPFATFFLKKFLGLDADLNDLPSLDPELYK